MLRPLATGEMSDEVTEAGYVGVVGTRLRKVVTVSGDDWWVLY